MKNSIITLLFALVFTTSAYAYIDPGSGSFIFQGLVVSFFSGLLVIKTYWKKLKAFFTKNNKNLTADTDMEKPVNEQLGHEQD